MVPRDWGTFKAILDVEDKVFGVKDIDDEMTALSTTLPKMLIEFGGPYVVNESGHGIFEVHLIGKRRSSLMLVVCP